FSRFLDPAGIEPAAVRSAELTIMMMQLVASGRGVCCLPNWAITEYLQRGYVSARRLGRDGLSGTRYAAVREDMVEMRYGQDFLLTAKDLSCALVEGGSGRAPAQGRAEADARGVSRRIYGTMTANDTRFCDGL